MEEVYPLTGISLLISNSHISADEKLRPSPYFLPILDTMNKFVAVFFGFYGSKAKKNETTGNPPA